MYILSTNLIDFYKEKLHYTRAIETCKKVLQIYDEIQNSEINIVCIKNVAIINLTLGELYCEIENYIEAETKYIKAYKLFEKLKFLNERIYMGGVLGSCSKLGELYEMQERYEEAEKQYRLLIEICREKRYTDFEAYLMRSIALYLKLVLLYKKVGKYSEVKTAYNKIQEYREQLIRRKNMNRF